ncbi:MAG: proteasome assembly chaperone family protein [Candidatus Aenigmatarchaeota archaeon]
MTTKINELQKPKLKNPVLIVGLPGVGNVGRIAAGYLIEELKATKFAELNSSHFMPFVLLQKGSAVHVINNEFYYWRGGKPGQRDIVILIGDSQSINPEGHYEIADAILQYAKALGVAEVFTLAGLGIGHKKDAPKVVGVVNDMAVAKRHKDLGIDFNAGDRVGTIVGAAGLLIGLGRQYGMDGICVLGETSGVPLIPDPKAAEAVLRVLARVLKVKIDTSRIQKKVKEMEAFIKRVEAVQQNAMMQLLKQQMPEAAKKDDKDLTYIG